MSGKSKKAVAKEKTLGIFRTRLTANYMNPAQSVSKKNKEELKEVYTSSGYEDVNFWVPPTVVVSQEECEAELLATLKDFVNDTGKQEAPADLVL